MCFVEIRSPMLVRIYRNPTETQPTAQLFLILFLFKEIIFRNTKIMHITRIGIAK